MKKTLRFAALTAAMFLATITTMLGGASRAGAQQYDEPIDAYVTTFYSDDTYQTVVGHIYPTDCRWVPPGHFYVQYTLVGTYTRYAIDEYAYTCGA